MNPRRLTGACFAVVALVLVVLSLVLPLLVVEVTPPPHIVDSMTITVWGFSSDMSPSPAAGPVNAVPVMFAVLLLVVAALLALMAAGSSAALARRRAAWISLTVAGAFTAGVAMTIVPQVTSWLTAFNPMSFAGGPQPAIGWGMWTLAGGAVFAVVAAALLVVPAREPQAAETPAQPADAEPGAS